MTKSKDDKEAPAPATDPAPVESVEARAERAYEAWASHGAGVVMGLPPAAWSQLSSDDRARWVATVEAV